MEKQQVIEIKTVKGNVIIGTGEIVYIKASNKHSIVVLRNKSEIISIHHLGWFEVALPKPCFFRCHKTYIINCHFFEYINYSSCYVSLNSYGNIPISRYRKKSFIENIYNMKRLS